VERIIGLINKLISEEKSEEEMRKTIIKEIGGGKIED